MIARRLGRAPSTISREIARNGGRGRYRAGEADGRAWNVARRPQVCKLAANGVLRDVVAAKLALDWSPQQIAGWLRVQHPDEPQMQVSHETIYLTLLVQARGALKRELIATDREDGASAEPLVDTGQAGEFRGRWESIQTSFVDEPRRAVEQADALVAELMQQLAETFSRERKTLEGQWDRGDDVSTEDLRVALQRYRSFFDRLLST